MFQEVEEDSCNFGWFDFKANRRYYSEKFDYGPITITPDGRISISGCELILNDNFKIKIFKSKDCSLYKEGHLSITDDGEYFSTRYFDDSGWISDGWIYNFDGKEIKRFRRAVAYLSSSGNRYVQLDENYFTVKELQSGKRILKVFINESDKQEGKLFENVKISKDGDLLVWKDNNSIKIADLKNKSFGNIILDNECKCADFYIFQNGKYLLISDYKSNIKYFLIGS